MPDFIGVGYYASSMPDVRRHGVGSAPARRNTAFAELRRRGHRARGTMRLHRALFRECSKVFHDGQRLPLLSRNACNSHADHSLPIAGACVENFASWPAFSRSAFSVIDNGSVKSAK
jgi:hypothetical protein